MTDNAVAHTDSSRPQGFDHVGIVVRSIDEATAYYSGRLGFPVVMEEQFEAPPVRLAYVDCGNAFLQLIEPVGPSPIADHLENKGEGVHHICFSSKDPVATAAALADEDSPEPVAGRGRGLVSSFVPGTPHHGVLIECNEVSVRQD